MTFTESQILQAINRAELIDARNRGDDERAKELSQEKQRLKKQRYCADCYVPVNGNSLRCMFHANKHRFWARRLTA